MDIEKLTKIIDPKIEKVLDLKQMDSLFKKVLESEYEKLKFLSIAKNRLEELINKTPTGDLRNDLTEINILLNVIGRAD
jgi:hypothetical protein